MSIEKKELTLRKREISRIEGVGLAVLVAALLVLLINPGAIGGIFDAMFKRATPIVVNVYLTGGLGTAIILSVMTGRILERLGFTDALVRIFTPIAKMMKLNPLVVVPAIYNILGDINASGRINGPVLKKGGATKDEQKIAIATMVQGNQSFSTLVLGLLAMSTGSIYAFPVIIIGLLLPLIVVPLLLRLTIYRDTAAKDITDLPRFTPDTSFFPTIFNGAREGAELLFLLLIPAAAVVFAFIGALEYLGVWQPIQNGLSSFLLAFSIDPQTGIQSVLVSPTLAMNTLVETVKTLNPRLVIGSFILAASGFPIQIIVAQIPAVWAQSSDLNEREAMGAAAIGIIIRIITALALAWILAPMVS